MHAAAVGCWAGLRTLLADHDALIVASAGLRLALMPGEILDQLASFAASDQLQRTVVGGRPVADRLAHGAQSAATAAMTLTSISAPGTPSPATTAAVTRGGAPGPESSGAIAP